MCLSVCVCVFPCNLGGYFVSLLIEPMVRKNVSPSDKTIVAIFEKNVFVVEKWSCKASSIRCHLKNFFTFADVNIEYYNASFCIFKALVLGLCLSS